MARLFAREASHPAGAVVLHFGFRAISVVVIIPAFQAGDRGSILLSLIFIYQFNGHACTRVVVTPSEIDQFHTHRF
jgi:hypothetical protein